MIKAVIMAGGEGTRLRPLTINRPKPMISVINKPVIEHTINLLKNHSINDIVISLFYLPGNVNNYFGDGSEWDVNITYSVEETPLGTAGGVKQAIGDHEDTFLVLSGDGIIDFDISSIVDFHKSKKSPFTIVLTRVKKPTEYGIVITKKDGRVEKFLEKPAWSEVFSDTVNTGMYVIEPWVIKKYVPENEKFDFSLNLFPLLQENKVPIYGCITDGYWCDVGNLDAYRDVHRDILDRLVQIDFPVKKIAENIWAGKNIEISPEAEIGGPVLLGDFVHIKKGAEVKEFSVIGNNCVVEEGASIRRSIILNSTIIGPKCEIRGAILGKRCVLEEGVSIYEGAVISDDCQIGSGATIPSGVRVWPDKIIEQSTRLTTDLIWGQTEIRSLFSSEGISGSFNVKINPEFAAKLGSAVGAFLGKNSKVIISRDPTNASRLIKRAITSGLLSMGVDIYDMEIESVPVNKYSIRFMHADMGIYVQILPFTGLQYIQIQLFDKYGFQLSINSEKKIETIFYRGDYPRKNASEVGALIYPTHNIESYISNVKNYVDHELLNSRNWDIIIDCFNGTASYVFPDLLAAFGCNATVLRGQLRENVSEYNLKEETRKAFENVVNMAKLNKEVAAMIGPHGRHLTVVDEMGNFLTEDELSALLGIYYLKHKKAKILNIPVTSSMIMDEIASKYEGDVVRISSKSRAPEETEDIFIESATGIYPYLEIDYDPMITFLLILEFASLEKSTLCELREQLPKSNMHRISIPCNTDEKATIMRSLTTENKSKNMQLIDGVRIIDDEAWILILPDATQPLIHLYAEGKTIESRDRIIDDYTLFIKRNKVS